jgi:hypothetical protein
MVRLVSILALAAGLAGCVVAPPYDNGYGYEPVPAYGYAPGYYGYAPGYYAAPPVSLGFGFGFFGGHHGHGGHGGGHGGHGGHGRH